MVTNPSPNLYCAIYTRKSVEEGLAQQYNTLDAQFDACKAYIDSQRHEGWHFKKRYDDGGYTGANIQRPAFQQLLADVEAKRIDCIVVYKVDRLSRSLADFTQLMTRFDANGIRFVSITQHFNTASSMGKLTLNMLLSFAQFEREVTAERISDKLYASKKKGLWTGGRPPLGYDVKAHQLVSNAAEAKVVKSIFQYYVQCGSLRQLLIHLNQNNITNKSWVNKQGNAVIGKSFVAIAYRYY